MLDPLAPPTLVQRPGVPPILAGLAKILAGGGDVAQVPQEAAPGKVAAPSAPPVLPPSAQPDTDAPPKSLQDAANMSAQAQSSAPPPPNILAASKASEPSQGELPDSLRTAFASSRPAPTLAPPVLPAPPLAPQHTFADKLRAVLPIIGMAGAGMEAAGNRGDAPNAARLQSTLQNQHTQALAAERLRTVDQPETQAHIALQQAQAAAMKDLVPVTVNGVTSYIRRADQAKILGQQAAGESRENVQTLRNTGNEKTTQMKVDSATQIAQLKAGAPMHVDAEWAKLAGQPQLAGQDISGATLQNFIKTLASRGYSVKDLGNEGLWATDKAGNRVRQVSVTSPSVARAEAFASARAANTPVDVFDENGNLTAISQKQQLQSGVPSAGRVFNQQGPTSTTRTMTQMAATIQPHLDVLGQEVKELAPYLGPLMGRGEVNFLAGTVGSTGNPVLDQKLGRLMSDFKLAASAVGRTHFAGRTGLPAAQYFGELLNAKRSPEELAGVLQSIPSYIEGYTEMSNFTPKQAASAPVRTPVQNQGQVRQNNAPSQSNAGQLAPEGTVAHMPDGSTQVKRGGKWVRQ